MNNARQMPGPLEAPHSPRPSERENSTQNMMLEKFSRLGKHDQQAVLSFADRLWMRASYFSGPAQKSNSQQ
jgi:hypothetical protein